MNILDDTARKLKNGGAFLTAGSKPNTMTVGWGQIGVMWGKPVFFVPVRATRYTKQLIEESGEFTVSVPSDGEFGDALKTVGTKSGRDCDKWAVAGLTPKAAKKVGTAVVQGCKHYFECKVISSFEMKAEYISKEDLERWYKDGNLHTVFVGEILEQYSE